jgi:hypothetical protein
LRPVVIDKVSDNALTSVLRYYNVREACANASGHFALLLIVTTNVQYSILLSVVTRVAIYVVMGTLFKSENVLCAYHHRPYTVIVMTVVVIYHVGLNGEGLFEQFGFILFIVFPRMASVTSNRGIRK